MDDYRIYRLDGAGRIVSGADSQCASDEAARVAAAVLLGSGGEAEIWQGVRCVGRVAIDPAPMPNMLPNQGFGPSQTIS